MLESLSHTPPKRLVVGVAVDGSGLADKALAAAASVGEKAWLAGVIESVPAETPFEERVRFAEA